MAYRHCLTLPTPKLIKILNDAPAAHLNSGLTWVMRVAIGSLWAPTPTLSPPLPPTFSVSRGGVSLTQKLRSFCGDLELSNVPYGIGRNIALHASRAARNSATNFCFPVHPIPFCFAPIFGVSRRCIHIFNGSQLWWFWWLLFLLFVFSQDTGCCLFLARTPVTCWTVVLIFEVMFCRGMV